MSISDEQAKEWAETFIRLHNNFYGYSAVFEDEEFTEEFPDEEDWQKVYGLMTSAKISVSWGA